MTTNKQDLNKCPGCGGEADNGFDRCMPPNVYYCTKCHQSDSVVENWKTTHDFKQALYAADKLLNEPYADPDDHARTVARQFQRMIERYDSLKQTAQQEKKELCNNQDMNNAILRVVHELSSVKEPQPGHIVEATDSIIEVIKFFARVDGGKLHFTNLSDRAQARGISVSDK